MPFKSFISRACLLLAAFRAVSATFFFANKSFIFFVSVPGLMMVFYWPFVKTNSFMDEICFFIGFFSFYTFCCSFFFFNSIYLNYSKVRALIPSFLHLFWKFSSTVLNIYRLFLAYWTLLRKILWVLIKLTLLACISEIKVVDDSWRFLPSEFVPVFNILISSSMFLIIWVFLLMDSSIYLS